MAHARRPARLTRGPARPYEVGMPPLGRWAALALLRREFRQAPRRARLHVLGRFLSAPLLRVVGHLPPGARLLDLGGGHGLFAHLALAAGARWALVVEPDRRKLLPPVVRPGRAAVVGYAAAVAGTFDAVAILDVLYRLPIASWDELLTTARDRLAPDGVLLVKEIDPTRRVKAAWNRAQERLADLLHLTLGESFSYETPVAMRARLAGLGFARVDVLPIGRGYPHAHVLYVARR